MDWYFHSIKEAPADVLKTTYIYANFEVQYYVIFLKSNFFGGRLLVLVDLKNLLSNSRLKSWKKVPFLRFVQFISWIFFLFLHFVWFHEFFVSILQFFYCTIFQFWLFCVSPSHQRHMLFSSNTFSLKLQCSS